MALTNEDRARGGRNGSRKGIPNKKTLARRLVAGLAETGSADATLKTVQEILEGRHGSALRLEIAKMVIEAGLNTNKELELARVKANLRSKELALASLLRNSSKSEAGTLYASIDYDGEVIDDDDEPDED
ncbi:hypothetical protein DD549_06710 [Shewanella algae]|uniref:hypothetical protein n=1 Tax=Shewanella algae TaxID=38313 RepID=UPI000D6510C1|nr:hypothetical protein [Shewanella algae]PWF92628.1 hypothetical protein DD549_06710 [Shewanella algae]